MSQEAVYRVSCASKGDLWYASLTDANAASYNILAGGEAVGLYPVPVPRTAEEFVGFLQGYQRRAPGGMSADVADKINAATLRGASLVRRSLSTPERISWLETEAKRTAHLPESSPERSVIAEQAARWGLELPQ